jgi:type I restriction enzyme, R subunit
VIGEIVIGYTEVHLVEKSAIDLFAQLGWAKISAKEEVLGPSGTLGRETKSEVILLPRLRVVVERLNPQLPAEPINSAIV